MKVWVYAIAKEEAAHAARWMRSVREADGVTVLDTGSTDGTPELLRALGAEVWEERIEPWRFDTARNRCLELAPQDADICVSVDLDEVFHPGWRALLEKAWTPGTRQAVYRYTWSFRSDGSEDVFFLRDQIHTRQGFRWKNPVHEVLEYTEPGPCPRVRVEGIQLDHHADVGKSREQYLGLLELAVAEEPGSSRNTHYLGREYMYRGRWEEAVAMLRRRCVSRRCALRRRTSGCGATCA